MLRSGAHYRMDLFHAGLRSCGYDVREAFPPSIQPHDVLVVWNRYGQTDTWAQAFERAGARVIVAENAYTGGKGMALALGQHNGAGQWFVGAEDRTARWNVSLKPWRANGAHILVLPQRGVGPPGVAMPAGWLNSVVSRLQGATRRPIKVRTHPGKDKTPLDPDLKDVWACVTWGSGAAIKAIIAGVPVFHELPAWIGRDAAVHGIADIEKPYLGDRSQMLHRVTWAQWTYEEIASGAPFRGLLA